MDKHDKLEQIRKKVQNNVEEIHRSTSELNTIAQKFENAANVAGNSAIIISDIEKEFNNYTSIINKKDQLFLWTAVALQCVRWIFQPKLEMMEEIKPIDSDRIAASDGKKIENPENSKWYKDNIEKDAKSGKYRNWKEYFTNAVPYDAMIGTEDIIIDGVSKNEKNLCGKNHHSSTLGHDPILGYIFGTFNIMTSTITFNRFDLLSRIVDYPSVTKEDISIVEIVQHVIESEREDKLRIPAAVSRQWLHLESDKYTKMGLPIPLLSAEKQQALLKQGWNSKEFDRLLNELGKTTLNNLKATSIQLAISCIISLIIYSLHTFMYDEKTDGDFELYSIRTSKIVTYSNIIAEGLNLAVVAVGTGVGIYSEDEELIKQSLSALDIGGYINAITSIVHNSAIQNKIKEDFLKKHWTEYVNSKLRG